MQFIEEDFGDIEQEKSMVQDMRQIFPKLKGAISLSNSFINDSQYKTIRVEVQNGIQLGISYLKADQHMITCGWLLSEVIRKLSSLNLETDSVIGLETKDLNVHMDYQLSCLERQIPDIECVLKVYYSEKNLPKKVDFSHFKIMRKIGAGGFSVVYLVKKRDTGKYFAMKVIDKQLMVERDREEIVFNEKNVLSQVKHKRIVALHYAFQTKTKLFFVLDFCPGGELYYHLRNKKRFTEDETRIIFIQILQGLKHLHDNNIIFRDLKPENILIDSEGYIKLADFGLSKIINKNKLNYSFCGSLEYMAPEMIEMKGHDYSLDYYSLGVLTYELMTGLTPFFAKFKQELIQNILKKEPCFPKYFSSQLQDLLGKLLLKNRQKRSTYKDIINHPWVQELKQKKIITPIQVKNEMNFDNVFLKQDILDVNNAPRCLSEEISIFRQFQKTSTTQNDEELGPYEKFANFSYDASIDI